MVGAIGCDLGQAGHAVGDVINVIEGEIHLALLCGCERVQDGVGGSAHGHVKRHGIGEGFLGGDIAGENGFVLLAVIAAAHIDDGGAGLFK